MTFHGGKHQRYAQETSWKAGDVVGCLYDGDKNELSFCLNGEVTLYFSQTRLFFFEEIFRVFSHFTFSLMLKLSLSLFHLF